MLRLWAFLLSVALLTPAGEPALARRNPAPPSLTQAAGLTVEDISPNTPNGKRVARASTAGLMLALAGDDKALYAVSLNAGVWKSVNGGAWTQLPNSPARANCIAVDPGSPKHLVVGERNGLAVDVRLNGAGVWESEDAGEHWRYTFDPLTLPGCASQAIPAVTFSRAGTLFVATAGGLGRRPRHARAFDFVHTPIHELVTALAISQHKVWARTRTQLFVSDDDGLSWTARTFPTQFGSEKYGFHSRGDLYSLAAFDTMAFLPCKPEPDPTGNHNTLLIYDLAADRWQVQKLDSGDGTGLGGRRYVKSFVLADPALPETIGGRLQLFYGAGQEVHQALGLNPDGTVRWDLPVQTDWGGPYARPPHTIHPDMWDVHLPPDYAPPRRATAWIACDGGVYKAIPPEKPPVDFAGRPYQMTWVTQNDGLHTHHIHTLTVLPAANGAPPRLAYPTSDNDGWFWENARGASIADGWRHEDYLGDANWTAGDVASPEVALIGRHARLAVLTAYGKPPPEGAHFGELEAITLNNDMHFDGPLALQFIQTCSGEPPAYPLLDAVLLAQLPLRCANDKGETVPASGPIGQPNPGGGPVLLRTARFLADPDANRSKFQNWQLEATDLPAGTKEFWVSGGHAHPTYYLAVEEAGRLHLFKRRLEGSGWQRLNGTGMVGSDFDLLDGGQYGPAFVNPYDPRRLFVLTKKGVKASTDGGETFHDEAVLTALLTESGTYPLAAGELTGNRKDAILASRANSLSTLSAMAFDRSDPAKVVAASPFTGVFTRAGDDQPWQTLSPALPHPLSAVSAVGIDGAAIYAATEGRGLLRLSNLSAAPRAAYFEVTRRSDGRNTLAVLRDAAQNALPGAPVQIRITNDHGAPVYTAVRKTDAQGTLFYPAVLSPGTYACRLHFGGNTTVAPCETAFLLEITPQTQGNAPGETYHPMTPKGYLCYRATGPITLDGRLDEPSWQSVPWTEDFVDIEGDKKPRPRFRTRAKMLWDDRYLYIAAELEEPHVWGTLTERDSVIFNDNDFEVFIDPDGDSHEYYELEMNALNTVWDLLLIKPYKDGGPPVVGWDIAGLKTGVHVDGTINDPTGTDRGWTVEMALPWKALAECAHRPCPPGDGDQWRINFSRVEWQINIVGGRYQKVPNTPEDNWVWSPQGVIDMHRPERWGYVQFCIAPVGQAVFHPDLSLPARNLLYRIYYAQRDYKKQHGHWAAHLSDLKLPPIEPDPAVGTPKLEVTETGFLLSVDLKLPDGKKQRWHLQDDARIWTDK